MFDSYGIIQLLQQHSIEFTQVHHPAVSTCAEAAIHLRGVSGIGAKNLFLRDKKGKNYFLVSVPEEKTVDLERLSELLNVRRLGFGSEQSLEALLGVAPGSVTILGLVNGACRSVQLIIDRELWDASYVQCHPLVNTSTVVISPKELERFLRANEIPFHLMTIPAAEVET